MEDNRNLFHGHTAAGKSARENISKPNFMSARPKKEPEMKSVQEKFHGERSLNKTRSCKNEACVINIKIATKEEIAKIGIWYKAGRTEEITCRPVVDGKRIAPTNESVSFLYFIDGSEEPAGKFTYFDINSRNRSAEFGYVVDPLMRGRGIGGQMLKDCVDKIFSTTDLNKLYGQTGSFNISSIKMLEKAGFKRDAVLREHHELDGKFYDDYIYSILRAEWQAK